MHHQRQTAAGHDRQGFGEDALAIEQLVQFRQHGPQQLFVDVGGFVHAVHVDAQYAQALAVFPIIPPEHLQRADGVFLPQDGPADEPALLIGMQPHVDALLHFLQGLEAEAGGAVVGIEI